MFCRRRFGSLLRWWRGGVAAAAVMLVALGSLVAVAPPAPGAAPGSLAVAVAAPPGSTAAPDPPGVRSIGTRPGDQHLVAVSRERFRTPGVAAVYVAPLPQTWVPMASAVLKDGPVLYGWTRGSLPPVVVAEIRRLRPRRVVGLGNPRLLSDATLRAAAPGVPITRIPGLDQYSLAVGVSRYRYPRPKAAGTRAKTVYS